MSFYFCSRYKCACEEALILILSSSERRLKENSSVIQPIYYFCSALFNGILNKKTDEMREARECFLH